MAFSKCFAALVAATTVLARTPSGFTPSSNTDLVVEYNGFVPLNGVVISKSGMQPTPSSLTQDSTPFLHTHPVTAAEPRIGTLTRLNGTSYAVMMIDLDIPTNNPPETNTLLHWMQTGLTPSSTQTQLNTTSGTIRAFLLENRANTSALAPYFGPSPPARVPLSHRYTQLLVDTSALTDQGLEALRTAAATRGGFNAATVLEQAGLTRSLVAGNSYNVTNPGPAALPSNTTTTTSAQGTGTGTAAAGGGTNQTAIPGGGVSLTPGGALVGGLVGVGVLILGL